MSDTQTLAKAASLGRLTTADAVIDALGGTKAVADLLSVGPSSVSNYRRLGFPARAHFVLAKTCEARGLDVADAVFGGISSAQTKPQRVAPQRQTTAAFDMFTAQGFTACASSIMQPAGPFIDRMGEEMRRRLYMFADPAGQQLCLRPDLTIPTALSYLAEAQDPRAKTKLAYEGLAFRYQPRGAGKPEEFYQAGVEIIGGDDSTALDDEGEILSLIVRAVEAAQVTQYQIVLNHLGMFTHFVSALGLSEGAQKRLERAYHQSANFDAVVQNMRAETRTPRAARDMALLTGDENFDIAGRSIGEINARITRVQNEAAAGLSEAQANAIQQFMQLAGPAEDVLQDMQALLSAVNAPDALDLYRDYWQGLFAKAGLPLRADKASPMGGREIIIAPAEGRKMAYYTGLAFEIHVPALGTQRVIASGGRYDDLLQSLGADGLIPAIGGAVALERLQSAAAQQGGIA